MAKRSRARKKGKISPVSLPRIRPQVAGIDLGSVEHWVCGPPRADGEANVERFGTITAELERLCQWLLEQQVESVAMESTHVYWIPLYELLEDHGIEVLLVNAKQLHNVPGRKTDMADCQWIQILHSCGLLRGSFRPDESICRLRALRRQMANLCAEKTRSVQWMQKALDQMNVQVHRAVTDLTGKTGMAIVRAIVAGQRDPSSLAALRDGRCRKSEAEIAEYLTGTWRREHLFNLEMALRHYDGLQEMIAAYEVCLLEEIKALQPPERRDHEVPLHPNPVKARAIRQRGEEDLRLQLWRFAGTDLTRIDGIAPNAARVVLTEIGTEIAAFPSEAHFVSWLRLAPKTAFSAGKSLTKKRNGFGATRVAGALRMAALSLQRSHTALGAYFRRIARRKDGATAVFATARKLAVLIYRMLRYGQDYVDIGEAEFEQQNRRNRIRGFKSAAKQLGYNLVPIRDNP